MFWFVRMKHRMLVLMMYIEFYGCAHYWDGIILHLDWISISVMATNETVMIYLFTTNFLLLSNETETSFVYLFFSRDIYFTMENIVKYGFLLINIVGKTLSGPHSDRFGAAACGEHDVSSNISEREVTAGNHNEMEWNNNRNGVRNNVNNIKNVIRITTKMRIIKYQIRKYNQHLNLMQQPEMVEKQQMWHVLY